MDCALKAAEFKATEEKNCHVEYVIKNSGVLDDGLKLNHRFFIYAKEGQIDRSKERYRRGEEDKKILEARNDCAHRATFKTHLTMSRAGHLSLSEINTFKQMYGMSPDAKVIRTEKFYGALDEMGTVAAFLSRIKFPGMRGGNVLYQEFKQLRTQIIDAIVHHNPLLSGARRSISQNKPSGVEKSEFDLVIDKCLPRMKGLSAKMKELDKEERYRDNQDTYTLLIISRPQDLFARIRY